MSQAKLGDTVKVHYTGKLDDGSVFDTSLDREPLEFTIGDGQIIPGFENAVVGMEPGEKKTVRIPAEEGFGPYYEEMIIEIGRDQMPPICSPRSVRSLRSGRLTGRP